MDNGPDTHRIVGRIEYERALKSANKEIAWIPSSTGKPHTSWSPGSSANKKEPLDKLPGTDLLARSLLENLL